MSKLYPIFEGAHDQTDTPSPDELKRAKKQVDKVLKPDYMCTVFLTSAPYPKVLDNCDIQT